MTWNADVADIDQLHAHLRGEHSEERSPTCTACSGLPAVSDRGGQPVRENTGGPSGRKCGCGCGAPVRNRFLPGHDAKLKSRLVREARSGSQAARDELAEHGWERFI